MAVGSVPIAKSGFLTELRAHLADFKACLRKRRAFGDVLQVEVGEAITADAAGEQAKAGQIAYTAEQAAMEAARLLDQVLADGKVTDAEIPLLKRAARHVHRSAERDHQITEVLA